MHDDYTLCNGVYRSLSEVTSYIKCDTTVKVSYHRNTVTPYITISNIGLYNYILYSINT
ncbi:uncharacterized protein METZ01_LOCUS235686 [marine metagenome]|uniref:Uncharacterized protein n=1 Tax=marine metagenome TaxID=408172 RepID=A0A382H6L2_9ZZZZ